MTIGVVGLAAAFAGCSTGEPSGAVFESALPAAEVRAPGPAYVVVPPRGLATMRTAEGEHGIGRVYEVAWTADGRLLVSGKPGLSVVDPATGSRVGPKRANPLDIVVTPDAVTSMTLGDHMRITVLSPDLSEVRVIEVPESAVKTDQLDDNSEVHVYGSPFTLGDVTWAEWGVNSEDDTKTDHGVLRIEGDEIREVQRNEPVVNLYPSTDGAAILMLRQSDGEEDCGGCTVSQDLVELDPRTGAVAASYGMPPDYDPYWRVNAVDKVGDRVAVRFEIGSSDDEVEPFTWQTWVYDGEWAPLAEAGGTRTWWQDGGRVVETPAPHSSNESSGTPYTLTWETSAGSQTLYAATSDDCARPPGTDLCPRVVVPGSLLPPAG